MNLYLSSEVLQAVPVIIPYGQFQLTQKNTVLSYSRYGCNGDDIRLMNADKGCGG